MAEKLTIICVLNQQKNAPYTVEWVRKLRNMVAIHTLERPYYFVCLSNVTFEMEGVSRIPLRYSLPGWWSKMEIFREAPESRVLYIDLDVLIYGDLWPIIDFPADFAICQQHGRPDRHNGRKVHGVRPGYNSSVMVFDRGSFTESIWEKFNENPKKWMKLYRGDQDFLIEFFPDLDTLPAKWVPKLGGCITKEGEFRPSKHAKVILCMPRKNHVMSREHEFVRKIWK